MKDFGWLQDGSFPKSCTQDFPWLEYRIYSINRPEHFLNFWTLRVGAYSRWALIKFSAFSTSAVCLFCNKTINSNNKTRRCNKARFLWNTLKKTPSSGKSLISTYSIFGGWGGAGHLFEFGWEWEEGGEGAYSRLGAYSNKYGILAFQTPELKIFADFKIFAFLKPKFKIFADSSLLAFKNPEFKILASFKILTFQNPEFTILAHL